MALKEDLEPKRLGYYLIILAIASRSAEGRMVVWQTFLVSWLALVIGGVAQFLVIRTFGRKL